jgi:hypothetical protein
MRAVEIAASTDLGAGVVAPSGSGIEVPATTLDASGGIDPMAPTSSVDADNMVLAPAE